jgi:shikimate kinase
MRNTGGSKKIIFLTGCTGTGKSTVGRVLARMLHADYVDTDILIEEAEGRPVSEIFDEYGEAYFRECETQTLIALAERPKNTDSVLVTATGGGIVLSERNRRIMRDSGTVVWLRTEPAEIARRLEGDSTRPLLRGRKLEEKLAEMMNERTRFYEDCDIQIETDDPDSTAGRIIEGIELD